MKTSTTSAGTKHRGAGGSAIPAFDFSSILRNIPTLTEVPPVEKKGKLADKGITTCSAPGKSTGKGVKSLAEAIILQSIEDLWSKNNQKESVEFFTGEGFRHCADMADLSVVDRLRIIRMLRKVNAKAFAPRHTQQLARISRSL